MKVKLKSRGTLLKIAVILAVVIIGAFLIWQFSASDDIGQDQNTANEEEAEIEKQPEITNVSYPEIEEVLNDTELETVDKFNTLVAFATGKQYFESYGEALVYYEAALELVVDDAEKTEYARYGVYIMAQESGDKDLESRYKDLIGEDRITQIKQDFIDAEATR